MRISSLGRLCVVLPTLLGLVVLVLSQPALGAEAKVLATIDDRPVTQQDLDAYLTLFSPGSHDRITDNERSELLENLINRILLLEEAESRGFLDGDEVKKHGQLTQTDKETIALRKLLRIEVSDRVHLDEGEIKTYMGQHPGAGRTATEEHLTTTAQKEFFVRFMVQLKKGRQIVTGND